MPPKKYIRAYFERNKQICFFVPEAQKLWFIGYLQKNSYGDNFSVRARNFLYELKQLEDEGRTFANARTSREADEKRLFEERYGKISDVDLICAKRGILDPTKFSSRDRELMCSHCKDNDKYAFKACADLKADVRKQAPKG